MCWIIRILGDKEFQRLVNRINRKSNKVIQTNSRR